MKIYEELEQGSDEWLEARRGLITASEMKLILTPTLKVANNDKTRAHVWELAAQRVTEYVEPHYISDDMLRGMYDEIKMRDIYSENYAPVKEVGFITNDKWGFTIGYSPDGLVDDDGLIEGKSRRQRFQFETIATGVIPSEFHLQLQTGLLVSERKWIDFISYSAGMPMFVKRMYPDEKIQRAILDAVEDFYSRVDSETGAYRSNAAKFVMTERPDENNDNVVSIL